MRNLSYLFLLFPLLAFASEPIQLTVLENGLTVYTKEDHARPLVSLFSIVDGGSRTEKDEIAGLKKSNAELEARYEGEPVKRKRGRI